MQITRTILHSRPKFKKTTERKTLEDYALKAATRKVRRIVFHAHDLGAPLDNLTKEMIVMFRGNG